MGDKIAALKIRHNGQVKELSFALPDSLCEVPLNNYIDYVVELRGIDTATPPQQLIKISRALAAFYGCAPLEDFLSADYTASDGGSFVNAINQLFGYTSSLIGAQIDSLKNDGVCTFEHAGANWYIPAIIQGALSGVLLPNISVIEAVEALEVERRALAHFENNKDRELREQIMRAAEIPATAEVKAKLEEAAQAVYEAQIEQKADPDGSQLFTRYVRMLALFARQLRGNDEAKDAMPIPDNERAAWIAERMTLFAGDGQTPCISAAAALKVDFFLSNILLTSKRTMLHIGFLTLSAFGLLGATRLRFAPKAKHTKGRLKKAKRRSIV